MDLMGPLETSKKGNKYVMTMIDGLSRYLVAVPIPDKTASTVMEAFVSRWVGPFGTCGTVKTDRGKEFTNGKFTKLLKEININHHLLQSYEHHSNLVERAHQTL